MRRHAVGEAGQSSAQMLSEMLPEKLEKGSRSSVQRGEERSSVEDIQINVFVFWGMGTRLLTPKRICQGQMLSEKLERDGAMLRRDMTGPDRGTCRLQYARLSLENTRK